MPLAPSKKELVLNVNVPFASVVALVTCLLITKVELERSTDATLFLGRTLYKPELL